MSGTRTTKRLFVLGTSLALLLVFAGSMPTDARTSCNTYTNSTIVVQGTVAYCGYSGGHCTECVSIGGGGGGGGGPSVSSCWSTGYVIICQDGTGGYYVA